jgi:methionyl-tRNA synthetase
VNLSGFFRFNQQLFSGDIMKTTTYITTSIPYVNGNPHIGFALELVQADVLARYYRFIGNDTRFQTGTDENAFKNVTSAQACGIDPRTFVNQNSEQFLALCQHLNVRYDDFIRTSESRHHHAVQQFWKALKPGDIFEQSYAGLYCAGCEDFYQPKDLVDGVCPDHGVPPIPVEETNYFFRLSAYQEQIEELVASNRIRITPESRRNEILSFIRQGLRDISISRLASRSDGWGVPVPGDPSQVVYVWIDALINYISGQGYGGGDQWKDCWNNDTLKIHVIGKNVWKFHAVYWPALLLSAGLPLPNEIVIHGFLTENGRKISKSNGPSVDPFVCIDHYGADAIRYYLLRAIQPTQDGDFSTERLREIYHADLANGLGNLVSRLTALAEKSAYHHGSTDGTTEISDYHLAIQRYQFDEALKQLWAEIDALNREIDREQPWKLLRSDNPASLHRLLAAWITQLSSITDHLAPLLPETARKLSSLLTAGQLTQPPPLFQRLE